ncbi:MAG: ABC transporter ATP-binding protein, partial [Holdemanella porci]
MEFILTADNLTKKYHHFKALNDFSLHIPKGSIYGFIGENGAGKTTFIRIICGLQNPDSGSYTLYGKKNTEKEITNARQRMGAIVEYPSIYLEMNAINNLKHQYQVLGLPSYEGISELLQLTGLSNSGNKKVKNFSLGMRQRLAIALTLAGNPDFLILDEPTNGLDPQGIIEIRELILRLNTQRQITFLISSHNLDELSRISTHYGIISNGSMIKEISAKELNKNCRKYWILSVTDTSILAHCLDFLNIEYEIVSDTIAYVYSQIPICDVSTILSKYNCKILSIKEIDETLESY